MKLNLYLTNKAMFFLIAFLAYSTQLLIKKSYTKDNLLNDLKNNKPIKEILEVNAKTMDETAKGMVMYIYINIKKVISELSNEINIAPEKIKTNKDLKNYLKKFWMKIKKEKL